MLKRTFTIVFTATSLLTAAPAASAAEAPGYDIIVIGGQSNAVGAGRGGYSDPYASKADPRLLFQVGRQIDNCVSHFRQIVPATMTLEHWLNCPRQQTVGFGLPYARRWAHHNLAPGRQVLIVPGAYGGSSSRQWLDTFWPALRDQIRWALKQKPVDIRGPARNRVVAFLWSQGETDSANCLDAPAHEVCAFQGVPRDQIPAAWRERLLTLFKDFRAEFDPKAEVPILATGFTPEMSEWRVDKDPQAPCKSTDGQTLDDPGCYVTIDLTPNRLLFEDQLALIEGQALLPNFAYIATKGLTTNGDEGQAFPPVDLPMNFDEARIHFGSQGLVDLAERLWQRTPKPVGRPQRVLVNNKRRHRR